MSALVVISLIVDGFSLGLFAVFLWDILTERAAVSDLPSNVETSATTEWDTLRNRVASRLANAALRLASPQYRRFVAGAIQYGMSAAARDVSREPMPNGGSS